jgi:hypothetical protein
VITLDLTTILSIYVIKHCIPVACGKDEKSGATERENPGECVKP